MTRTILEIFISRRRKINPRGGGRSGHVFDGVMKTFANVLRNEGGIFLFFFFGWISVVVIISIISSTRTAHAMTQTNKWRRVISSGEDSVEMTLLSTGTYI